MTYCNQCQLVHGEEQRFCQRCGQLLKPAPASATRPCPRCGAPIFPGQKFCTDCGLPLRVAAGGREEFAPQNKSSLFYPRAPETRASRRRRRPTFALGVLVVLLLVAGGYYGWRKLVARPAAPPVATVAPSPQEELRREVEKLAEKIRTAHLNKDINKWLSCYSPSYPNLGRVEGQILELWKNYDVREVSYRISKVQQTGDSQGTAAIVWNIQVFDHRTHDYTLLRPAYRILLERVNGGWKIRDSKEETGEAR